MFRCTRCAVCVCVRLAAFRLRKCRLYHAVSVRSKCSTGLKQFVWLKFFAALAAHLSLRFNAALNRLKREPVVCPCRVNVIWPQTDTNFRLREWGKVCGKEKVKRNYQTTGQHNRISSERPRVSRGSAASGSPVYTAQPKPRLLPRCTGETN